MNIIPSELIAVPNFHGYFWHPYEEVLYSLKIGGTLRPLKICRPWFYHGQLIPLGFNVCRNGRKTRKSIVYLRTLKPNDYMVPYETRSSI